MTVLDHIVKKLTVFLILQYYGSAWNKMLTISLLFARSFFNVLCYELMKKQMYLFFCDNHKIFSHLEYTLKADFYRGGLKV